MPGLGSGVVFGGGGGGAALSLSSSRFSKGGSGAAIIVMPSGWTASLLSTTGLTSTLSGSTLTVPTGAAGSGTAKLRAASADGRDAVEKTFDVVVADVPSKVTISGVPAGATVGTAYTFTPATANGAGTKTFARSGPALPSGWTFSTTTGAVANSSPSTAATITIGDITVTDDTGTATLSGLSIVVSAASAAAFSYGMIVVDQSDSIGALDDDTSFPFMVAGAMNGFLRFMAASKQGISGSEVNEEDNAKNINRADRMALYGACLGPGVIARIAAGTNSIDIAADRVTAGLQQYYDLARSKGSPIIAHTILPSASNQSTGNTTGLGNSPKDRYTIINNWIRSKAANDLIVVDGGEAWGETWVGNTDTGNLHPVTAGTLKIAAKCKAAFQAKGYSVEPQVLFGTVNPSDNLVTNWNLAAGVTGSKTGTSTTNGDVPTGVTVLNSVAGLTLESSVITVTRGGKTYPRHRLVANAGNVTAQGTVQVSLPWNTGTAEPAGSTYEAFCDLKIAHSDGVAAPVGLSGIGVAGGSLAPWASANTASVGGVVSLITQALEYVTVSRAIPAAAATQVGSFIVSFRVEPGTPNFAIEWGQPYMRKSERGPAVRPAKYVNTNRDDMGGTLVGPTFTGTAANGNTLTGRPGPGVVGEARTFTYQWQRTNNGGTTFEDISGATALAYAISGQSGYQLRMRSRVTNTVGGTVYTDDQFTAWSTAVA